jgi:hypothetical protein
MGWNLGKPAHLPIDVNRAVFYVFEEALAIRKNMPGQAKLMFLPNGAMAISH